jgi:RNA polymerase sigma factor (sigma-70 family)
MAKDWSLTQESFETLLDWLDSERESAGQKYETIRRRLIKIFYGRGCHDPEDLADETINRVAYKVKEFKEPYKGDPALFFYGIAQKICLEARRKKTEQTTDLTTNQISFYIPVLDEESDEYFLQRNCLNKCLVKLSPDDRGIVIKYYASEEQTNIEHRQRLAEQSGLSLSTLRVRAFRIRQRLQKCVQNCLQRKT